METAGFSVRLRWFTSQFRSVMKTTKTIMVLVMVMVVVVMVVMVRRRMWMGLMIRDSRPLRKGSG